MADMDKLPGEIRPRIKLSTGTELAFYRMENGATSVDPTHGGAMTNAEYREYLSKTGVRNNDILCRNSPRP